MLYPQTSAWRQQPFSYKLGRYQVYLLALDTFCTNPRSSRQRFYLSYIYTSSKWYSQHLLNFGQVKKMHLNFGTCPHTQEADPNSNWGRYPRTKGLGKSGGAERILQPVYKPGAVGPPGWHIYSRDAVPSNWHLSLPLLAEPASVPCSTVQPTGITFQFRGHSVQIRGSRT